MNSIVIVVRGGCVQCVYANCDADVELYDFDNLDAEEECVYIEKQEELREIDEDASYKVVF